MTPQELAHKMRDAYLANTHVLVKEAVGQMPGITVNDLPPMDDWEVQPWLAAANVVRSEDNTSSLERAVVDAAVAYLTSASGLDRLWQTVDALVRSQNGENHDNVKST